jgi:hypothetical protein
MEETPENNKELLHSAHANGMNEWLFLLRLGETILVKYL